MEENKTTHSDNNNEKTGQRVYVEVLNTIRNRFGSRYKKELYDAHPDQTLLKYLNKPPIFQPSMNIRTWLTSMETYVTAFEKKNQIKVMLSYLSVECLNEIKDIEIIVKADDGVEQLKNKLIEKFTNVPQKSSDKVLEIKNLSERKQNQAESIEEYGESLIKMAQIIFPQVSVDLLDNSLKVQFINGLENSRLREQVRWKLHKTEHIENKKMTIHELINYAKWMDRSFDQCESTQKPAIEFPNKAYSNDTSNQLSTSNDEYSINYMGLNPNNNSSTNRINSNNNNINNQYLTNNNSTNRTNEFNNNINNRTNTNNTNNSNMYNRPNRFNYNNQTNRQFSNQNNYYRQFNRTINRSDSEIARHTQSLPAPTSSSQQDLTGRPSTSAASL